MAKKGLGTTITINGTLIGGLTNIKPPERNADTIEVTTLDASTGYKDFIVGLKEGGEIQLSGFYEAGNAGQPLVNTAFENGTTDTYVITFPTSVGGTFTCSGIVTKLAMPGEANVKDALAFECTIKIVGQPVLATVASGGLTGLTLSGTAGTLAPAFNNAKYVYSWVFTTDTSITVTPTAASHTIKLYVDGVYVQDITSGQASSAITGFTAASGKKIELVVFEAAKSPKTYTVSAIRSS